MRTAGRGGAAACVALCVQLLPGGHALRRQGPWPAGFEEEEVTTTPPPQLYGDLPEFKSFKKDFIKRRNVELFDEVDSRIPGTGDLKMIIGVWTRPYMKMYREVVRQTWMTQSNVCPLRDGPQEDCSIYTTFVMGTSGDGVTPLSGMPLAYFEDARSEQDMMLLHTVEKMKHAKMLEYFYKAAKENPWATHVAKVDMQTYPLIPKLITRMYEQRACHYKYELIGEPMRCNRTADNDCDMPEFWNKACRISDCIMTGRPFDYIAGPFVAMSRQLAFESMHPERSLFAKRVNLGIVEPEDRALARSLFDFAWDHDECVHVWDPIAMHHPHLHHDPSF